MKLTRNVFFGQRLLRAGSDVPVDAGADQIARWQKIGAVAASEPFVSALSEVSPLDVAIRQARDVNAFLESATDDDRAAFRAALQSDIDAALTDGIDLDRSTAEAPPSLGDADPVSPPADPPPKPKATPKPKG